MFEAIAIICIYISFLAIPFVIVIGAYYLVIYHIYRRYKRNGGIYNFRKFIARKGLEL